MHEQRAIGPGARKDDGPLNVIQRRHADTEAIRVDVLELEHQMSRPGSGANLSRRFGRAPGSSIVITASNLRLCRFACGRLPTDTPPGAGNASGVGLTYFDMVRARGIR